MGQETIFEEIIIEISRINKNRNPWIQEYYQIPSKIKKKRKKKKGKKTIPRPSIVKMQNQKQTQEKSLKRGGLLEVGRGMGASLTEPKVGLTTKATEPLSSERK